MVQDPMLCPPEKLRTVAAKLQAFFETLDEDERPILAALLLDACGNPAAARCLLLSARSRTGAAASGGRAGRRFWPPAAALP